MAKRKTRMTARLAALVGCVSLCILFGCDRGGSSGNAPEADAAKADWSRDPAFRKALAEQHDVAKEIGVRRAAVQKRMDEMVAIMKEKLGTKDAAKAEAALADNAEWKSLKAKAAGIDAEFQAQRKKMLELTRRQMNGKELSK